MPGREGEKHGQEDAVETGVIPDELGSYRILRLLGKGGFARVYLGEHQYLSTVVAIKVLHSRETGDDWQGFLDEAHSIAHLRHPHIVRVLDFGMEEDIPYLVMDYAKHGSLRKLHPAGSVLSPVLVLTYVQQVASALQYAHSQNVIHCDVKPENLLVDDNHSILLSDFGLATVAEYRRSNIQQGGAGTPLYMAPEQMYGEAGRTSDQYALGILTYEWLCGQPPFRGSRQEIIEQHLHRLPPPLRTRGGEVPAAVEQVVLRALAKDPQERYSDVQAFADALTAACEEAHVAIESEPHLVPNPNIVTGIPGTEPAVASSGTSSATPVFPEPYPGMWNVPYHRNPFFTGREEVIAYLHEAFSSATAHMTAQALTGLGGIGKTHAAIEYAYRYRAQYQAVFWATATTHAQLVADFIAIAALLELPEQHRPDERDIVQAVKRWLQQQSNWLLILDNVDDLNVLEDFIPPAHRGHILLTTRAQATGMLAENLEIECLNVEEGAIFLLRRAKMLKSGQVLQQAEENVRTVAMEIAREMDGLPLAIDQSGAYLEETRCNLAEYLAIYRQRRAALLKIPAQSNHPTTVATTWSLSFERLEHLEPAAAELLRLYAFLHAEAIPEEIVTTGASVLGPVLQTIAADPFQFNAAMKALRNYSLVRRNPDNKMLSIHRLVQAVLKDRMSPEVQQLWSERTVRAINAIFPEEDSPRWRQCERYLPHAQVCAELIAQWDMAFPEAMQLLERAAASFSEHGQFSQAEALLKLTLDIRQRHLGPHHPEVAISLYALGALYHARSDYALAEEALTQAIALREQAPGIAPLDLAMSFNMLAVNYKYMGEYTRAGTFFQRALAILETMPDAYHSERAAMLNNMARLYEAQGKYPLAEPLYTQSLAICERTLGSEHFFTSLALSNLAHLYYLSGKYSQAEPLLIRARAIVEQTQGLEHPQISYNLTVLGQVYQALGKYQEAETHFKRSLALREKTAGAEHPASAQNISLLGSLAYVQGNYALAEQQLTRSLPINEQRMGPEHSATASNLHALGKLYTTQARFDSAEAVLLKALHIREKALNAEHPDLAESLDTLAQLYLAQGKYDDALSFAKRALSIREQALGEQHPGVAESLLTLAQLSFAQGRYTQARIPCQRALAIQQQLLGEQHPSVAQALTIQANLLLAQQEVAQAEQSCLNALAIREIALGYTHPLVARSLNTLAEIALEQQRYELAHSSCERALAIRETAFGDEHPDVAQSLSNLAEAYRCLQGADREAEVFFRRALETWERTVGSQHPDIAITLNNLALLYGKQGRNDEAEALYQRALAIYEQIKGQQHPDVVTVLENYAALLHKMKQAAKAKRLESQVKKLRAALARQNKEER